ncbi:hypothetical protein AKJ09_05776 [Labilithrix luteola]|uniref:Uncharacterized protein n=1 Tax=Labilithrix luteola TaxID=1391654 RepID=A0A0K1Q038_9BACT|nr:hypothetical protein [Labilithrix luteola]AKU99112.1 hypothetical protein AKJ09_05776 [Labilithrix luteola]
MRKTVAAFAILVGTCTTRSANAELPLALDWNAPKECPQSSYVVRRVEQILRGMTSEGVGVVATAKIVRPHVGRRYELSLTVRSGDFEETKMVSASSCAGLAEAAAVVIALAIRSTEGSSESEVPPSAESAPTLSPPAGPTTSEPPPPSVPSPVAPAPSLGTSKGEATPEARLGPSLATFAFDLGGSVVSGVLPHAAPGLDVAVVLRVAGLRAGALGTFSLRQTPTYGETARASFDMIDAGAFAAYLLPVGVFALGPASNLEATFVRVQGYGIRTPEASRSVWPTFVFGARAEARLTRWIGLFARADLVFPLGAPRFTLLTEGDSVALHEPAAFSPRLSLGIEIVVP